MRHLDLFSGIGGFAIAVEAVWPDAQHIFCDNDNYCQNLLKLRFPNSKVYEDVKEIKFIADSDWDGLQKQGAEQQTSGRRQLLKVDILTGGFPCQPFSQAGKRRGMEDDRYLWPEMFRVIQLTKPRWVIAENVRGLFTMQGGLVFEQVCSDLEKASYQVQSFIIPAVSVNAPHRRDRIWFIAHSFGDSANRKKKRRKLFKTPGKQKQGGTQYGSARQSIRATFGKRSHRFTKNRFMANRCLASNAKSKRGGRRTGKECRTEEWTVEQTESKRCEIWSKSKRCYCDPAYSKSRKSWEQTKRKGRKDFKRRSWNRNWLEIAAELCGVDDGLSAKLDGFELSKSRHRTERLKALGNAIVPQVAIEILKAIKVADEVGNA